MAIETLSINHNPVLANSRRFSLDLLPAEVQDESQAPAGSFTGYSDTIRGMGGFWEIRFAYHDELHRLAEMLEFGWMREVRSINHRHKLINEGFIHGMEFALEGDVPYLQMTIQGYVRTLFWRVWNQTAVTTDANISDEIYTILTGVGQFIGSVSRELNVTQVSRKNDADRWAGDICFDYADVGDTAAKRYLLGVYDNRQAIYEQIARYETF